MTSPHTALRRVGLSLAFVAFAACGGAEMADEPMIEETGEMARALGPIDGLDLPGAAPERIAVGDPAPDFNLMSFRGDTLGLTDYRGEREVILAFYRGHW